jgi:hypothetical protein
MKKSKAKTNTVEDMLYPSEAFYELNKLNVGIDDEIDSGLSNVNQVVDAISFIELSVINSYLLSCYKNNKQENDVNIITYGKVNHIGQIEQGGAPEDTESFWFMGKLKNYDYFLIFQTRAHINNRGDFECFINISTNKKIKDEELDDILKHLKKVAFNSSKYVGKMIKVKFYESSFHGIEIIENSDGDDKDLLVLNDVQNKFIEHFVNVVSRGGNLRYLLNGEPGTGKTKTIREIAKKLLPNSTFIIPDFVDGSDLSTIIETCNIFDKAVIIMDDIDLYIGSRDNGGYTQNLGEFLTIFDGLKKQKISFIASTNDKKLVDKAAERPGRFNFIIDYGFLTDEQIIKVCELYLPQEWQIKEIYSLLTGKINGKKTKITGAFIYNLSENIKDMSVDNIEWTLNDTIQLIKESYKGFYHSQIEVEKDNIGFGVVKG